MRESESVVGDAGEKDALLIEYIRRLVLDCEGKADPGPPGHSPNAKVEQGAIPKDNTPPMPLAGPEAQTTPPAPPAASAQYPPPAAPQPVLSSVPAVHPPLSVPSVPSPRAEQALSEDVICALARADVVKVLSVPNSSINYCFVVC